MNIPDGWVIIKNQFDSHCQICNSRIFEGERCYWKRFDGIQCLACLIPKRFMMNRSKKKEDSMNSYQCIKTEHDNCIIINENDQTDEPLLDYIRKYRDFASFDHYEYSG